MVLQYKLDGVEFDQLPDTTVADGEVIEQLQSLLCDDTAGSPALEVSHSEWVSEGGRETAEGEYEGNNSHFSDEHIK